MRASSVNMPIKLVQLRQPKMQALSLLVVGCPGAGLVPAAPSRPSLVMLTWMLGMGEGGDQPTDLPGGQRDEVIAAGLAVVMMLRRCPGKLSTGAGAPFEQR
jgi:hypothetical protein